MSRIKAKKKIIEFQKDTGGTFILRIKDPRYADNNTGMFPKNAL